MISTPAPSFAQQGIKDYLPGPTPSAIPIMPQPKAGQSLAQFYLDSSSKLAGVGSPTLPALPSLAPPSHPPPQGAAQTGSAGGSIPQSSLPPPGPIPGATHMGNAIVRAAEHFLGVPYVWGGESPKGFDCSGLVQYVFRQFGITTPRVSEAQFQAGRHVNPGAMQPGDLIFFREPGGDVGHVGIYAGNGQFVEAPHTGDVVKIMALRGYGMPIAGIRRYA